MVVAQRPLTLEEFLKLSEEEPALEYEDGVVTQKVSPKGKHSRLQYEVAAQLNRAAGTEKIGWAFPELRTTFAGRSYVPDVAYYAWNRIPWETDGEIGDEFVQPPDVAVEIVSPGQSVNALVRRCLWYVGNGVRAALLVDPKDHSVLLFRPGHPLLPLSGADAIDLSDLIPGFGLGVADLFGALRG